MARLVTKFGFIKQGSRKKSGNYASYIATREGVEKYTEEMPDGKTYADYIATRPRVEKFGIHGLFTDQGVEVRLSKVSEELNCYEGNVWTLIISMRREDAERLGFDTGARWRDLLRSQTETIAKSFKIPLGNLKWYAAFHNESHHPHVHLLVYSKDEREGFLTKQGVKELRASLAKDLFAQDLYMTYLEKTRYRNELKKVGRGRIETLLENIRQRPYENETVEILMRSLARGLSKHKGRKVYAFLKPELKNLVDEIVEELGRDRQIKELYELWYEKKETVLKTYSETMLQRLSLSQNPEFYSLKNMIIQECAKLGPMELLTLPEKTALVTESTLKIFRRFGEVFANQMQGFSDADHFTDRKLKQRLQEKKQAQGLK